MSLRLFVAVDLGEPARAAVRAALSTAKQLAPRAKWVHADSTHVTLAFLGQRPETFGADAGRALEAVALRRGPFEVTVGAPGTFGSATRPRVLWLGLEGQVDALKALQSDVEAALRPLGYEAEKRPFSPHLTLARAREPGGDAALAACAQALRVQSAACRVEAVTLYRSDLSSRGAKYTVLLSAALSRRA